MSAMSGWTCVVRGHAFRSVTHQGSAYQYCLRCGKATVSHEDERANLRRKIDAQYALAEAGHLAHQPPALCSTNRPSAMLSSQSWR